MSDGMPPGTDSSLPSRFATTHWSLVAAAGGLPEKTGQAALAELCQRYWYPLYVWLRRTGSDHEDAQDLVQAFLVTIIELRKIDQADPQRGRFRSFLLASLKNFRANYRRGEQTQKRGGMVETLQLNFDSADSTWAEMPFHEQTPDRLFDRKWALQLIDRSLRRLEQVSRERGREELFERVKPILSGADEAATYQSIADQFGMTVNAIKVAVHRWREQLREMIRQEIRETVVSDAEVDEELEHLFSVLTG